jgi:hypothetical protein
MELYHHTTTKVVAVIFAAVLKSRTFKKGPAFVEYKVRDVFDWLAIVILGEGLEQKRRIFLIPRAVAEAKARRDKPTSKTAELRYWRIDEVAKLFVEFENNFSLLLNGRSSVPPTETDRTYF